MLQAMNTGHDGSMTTIHANNPREALSRVETLVLTAGVDLPLRAIREQAAGAIDLIVQVSRLVDGSRRITHITEVGKMEGDLITLQDLFIARPDEEGAETGGTTTLLNPLKMTGIKPGCLDKLAQNGVVIPASFFASDSDTRISHGAFGQRSA
jgi:pilus assembly protein CpaF